MAINQPYMYDADRRNDSRFPTSTFDPKAVTRASWEKKPPKPKQNGPLLSFNRHPDAHMVLSHRSAPCPPMSSRTKSAIKWTRRVQLGLRVLELNAAVGILALMILLDKIDTVKAWVMRLAPGVLVLHCLYSIYHLSRDASGRTPSSSAAYQVFSVFGDFAALGLYAFGAFTTHSDAQAWSNRIPGRADLTDVFVPAVYYAMVVSGGIHVVSLVLSLWLAWAFRRISTMPPDMNPLEDNLTARPKHKRKQSSVTTLASTVSTERLSTAHGRRPDSQTSFQNMNQRRTMPFMHTRQNSSVDMPERQYQIVPSNTPRNSAVLVEPKHLARPMSAVHGTYAEIPTCDPSSPESRADQRSSVNGGRAAKFVEAWAPTDSLVTRTNERNRQAAAASRQNKRHTAYAALAPRYYADDFSDEELDRENTCTEAAGDVATGHHPDPLGSNPPRSPRAPADRTQTPFHAASQAPLGALHEISSNQRRMSNGEKIADPRKMENRSSMRWPRNRDSSIQPDSGFYSKPYGELKSATPPVMVDNDRKTSTGNDFGAVSYGAYERRNVSGKIAEEGRVGRITSSLGMYSNNRNW